VGAICALLCFWEYLLCSHTRESRLPIVIIFLSIFAFYRNVIIPAPPGEQTYRSIAVLINAKAEATIFNVTFEHVCGGNGNGNVERFHLMASGGWTASLFSRL